VNAGSCEGYIFEAIPICLPAESYSKLGTGYERDYTPTALFTPPDAPDLTLLSSVKDKKPRRVP
jgi:hypothetical protein